MLGIRPQQSRMSWGRACLHVFWPEDTIAGSVDHVTPAWASGFYEFLRLHHQYNIMVKLTSQFKLSILFAQY